MTTYKIKEINSTFPNIHRLILENEMILDVFEYNKPVIGHSVKYYFYKTIDCNDKDVYDTELNGDVYDKETKWVYISFKGLLCVATTEDVSNFKIFDKVSLKYSILRN